MDTSEKNGIAIEAIVNHLVRLQSCEEAIGWCTVQCKMLLFCAKTMKE